MLPVLPKVTRLKQRIITAFGGIDRRDNAKENGFSVITGADNKGGIIETYGSFYKSEMGYDFSSDDIIVLSNDNDGADYYYLGEGGFYKNGSLLPFNMSEHTYSGRSWVLNYVDDIGESNDGKFCWTGNYQNTSLLRYGEYIFAVPQMIMTDGEKTYKWDRTEAVSINNNYVTVSYGELTLSANESWRKQHFDGFKEGDIIELFNNGSKVDGIITVLSNKNGTITLKGTTEEGAKLSSSAFNVSGNMSFFVMRHKDVPHFTDADVIYNRMWGVSENRIYASKLAHPFAFKETDGASADAWWADTEDANNFTAITSLNGRVVAFKNTSSYEIYGTVAPYTVKDVSRSLGCIDKNSLGEVNGVLFLLTSEGMQVYGGSKFVNINDEPEFSVKNACGKGHGSKYYAIIGEKVYKYDYYSGFWTCVTDCGFVRLIEISGEIFGLKADGTLVQFTGEQLSFIDYDGTVNPEWCIESVTVGGGDFYAEGINRLEFRFEGSAGGRLAVAVSRDNGNFESYADITVTKNGWQIFSVPIYMKPCSVFKYRIEGSGKLRLRLVKYCYRKGGEANSYEHT